MSRRDDRFKEYWTTKIGQARDGEVLVRGYPAADLIANLSFAEACYLIIRGDLPTPVQARALDAVLRCGLDQAFINSATPPARFAASASPGSPAAAIAAGVIAFGSVTGSPGPCAKMLISARNLMAEDRLDETGTAERILDRFRQAGEKIPGLGHPMHRTVEPRAGALRSIAIELGVWGETARLLDALQSVASRRFERPLPINLVGAIAAVLLEIGFDPLEMTGIGIIAYMPSLIAHVCEEIREGVPLRIIPEELGAHYAGEPKRSLPYGYGMGRQPGDKLKTNKEHGR